ncbi:MAG: hypothetical protein WBA93_28845 [Microcoleaceae cyanobacterium]
MNNIDTIVNQLSNEIYHQDLTIKPSYYDDLNKIFAEQDLPKLLRHEIIKKNDRSIPLFLSVVKEYFKSLDHKSLAILCSGSGLLSEEIYSEYFSDLLEIDHFDKSEAMLKNSLFANQKYSVDLSKPLNLEKKYDLVLAHGCLRYFSNCLLEFGENITRILSTSGCFILGEVDIQLVSNISQILGQFNLEIKLDIKKGKVFRNTLFYALMLKYKSDSVFRNLVLAKANLNKSSEEIIIELAGFKEVDYSYCIARYSNPI